MYGLPILQELFRSDSLLILLFGFGNSLAIGFFRKGTRKNLIVAAVFLAVYLVCEVVENKRTNFLIEILMVWIGSAALGCAAGFLLSALIRAVLRAI